MPDVKIMVRMNGPLRVYGPFTMVDVDDKEFTIPEGEWVTLCRCGRSGNKPFCDSTHRNEEPIFEAPSAAF